MLRAKHRPREKRTEKRAGTVKRSKKRTDSRRFRNDVFYSTGQAAHQLGGVSQARIRALCQSGAIAAETTPGGQWRISDAEIARLRTEGLPPVPRATPATESSAVSPTATNGHARTHPRLLSNPSPDAIAAADKTVVLENQVKALHLTREKEQTLDWFRERENIRAAAHREARQRSAEIEALRERKEWLDEWLDFALRSVPADAPREFALSVQETVEETLGRLDPEQPRHVVQRLVLAAVDKALRPWRRSKETEKAIEEARNQLPCWAKEHRMSDWELRAVQAATDAIAQLRNEATSEEMRAVAIQAGKQVAKEYEHGEACRWLMDSIVLPGGTVADYRAAQQAVKDGLDKLPVGASQVELEKSRETTLAPFRAAARAAAQAEQHLAHINKYLERLATEDKGGVLALGDFFARHKLAQDLQQRLRPVLTEKLKQQPLSEAQAREFTEEFIECELDLSEPSC